MNRRTLIHVFLGIGSLAGACLPVRAQGKGRGRRKDRRNEENGQAHGNEAKPKPVSPSSAARIILRFNATIQVPRDLPPGLRKKYARTGQLPPGWEKKMQPFPPELVRVLPPPPPNTDRGFIDGVAVTYDRKTRLILDSVDLIAGMARR
jgi:hypothetical protein